LLGSVIGIAIAQVILTNGLSKYISPLGLDAGMIRAIKSSVEVVKTLPDDIRPLVIDAYVKVSTSPEQDHAPHAKTLVLSCPISFDSSIDTESSQRLRDGDPCRYTCWRGSGAHQTGKCEADGDQCRCRSMRLTSWLKCILGESYHTVLPSSSRCTTIMLDIKMYDIKM
jgi:hypothetical protein